MRKSKEEKRFWAKEELKILNASQKDLDDAFKKLRKSECEIEK